MGAVVEGWRVAGPYWPGALGFLLVLSMFIAIVIEFTFFLPGFLNQGIDGAIVWILLTIGTLVPMGLMVYSSYWDWQCTKYAHYRITWANWRATSKAVSETLEKHGFIYNRRSVSVWRSFMSRMKEELIISEGGPKILIRGGGNRGWSAVFVVIVRAGDDSGLESVKNLIDDVLPIHNVP